MNNNNLNNNPFDDWGFPKSETETPTTTNNINTEKNNISIENIDNYKEDKPKIGGEKNIISKEINNNSTSEKYSNYNIKEAPVLNKYIVDTFFRINMRIISGLLMFGLLFMLFGALNGIDLTYILILVFCFGYSGIIIILYIIYTINNIRKDIKQNGFSIFGNTPERKAKNILLFIMIILAILVFLCQKIF